MVLFFATVHSLVVVLTLCQSKRLLPLQAAMEIEATTQLEVVGVFGSQPRPTVVTPKVRR